MAGEIDEIKARVDVVDLISEYIRLKQSGTNWKGLCPFHNEKSPSFMVSRDKQIWHCFGCSEGGDIFTFIQKIEGVEFAESLKILAQRAGVKLQNQNPESISQKNSLVDICSLAASFWHKILLDSPKAQIARDYLNKRGVTNETIVDFKLGYAPDSWDVTSNFLDSKGFKANDIFLAGLTVKKDRGAGFYDRFRDRIMFPIADLHGRVVGFSGRTLKSDESAKYINTPQTDIYNKSLVIYNLNAAKGEIKSKNLAIMVEGQMDVVSTWQAGTKNVVASSGTAMTLEQVQILKRYTNNLAIAFDADLAGQSAAKRGIDIALSQELNVKVIILPTGVKDPDECIKKNPADWFLAIENAKSIMDYYFEQMSINYDLTKPEGKKETAKILLPVINKIGNKIEQEYWLKKLASLLNSSEDVLKEMLTKVRPVGLVTRTVKPAVAQASAKKDRQLMLAENLVALLLKYPQNLAYCVDALGPEFIDQNNIADLYKKLIIYYTTNINSGEKDFVYSDFKQQIGDSALQDLADVLILLAEKDFFDFDDDSVKKEVGNIIHDLKQGFYRQKISELQNQINTAEQLGQKEKVNEF
ncbi:MAG: DNA primase, partial [Candidatus Buchananbacteria bacterium]|nr:DNA primase [Candidatus Buchananbacteria bacterium]